jgi:hypothetical protein
MKTILKVDGVELHLDYHEFSAVRAAIKHYAKHSVKCVEIAAKLPSFKMQEKSPQTNSAHSYTEGSE